jgi:5'-nucleotidase
VRLRRLDERRFAVKGTPTDSVLMAIRNILPEQPDLVLSGVNRGQNLCEDVTYSGTVAAAMEGTVFGVPSIALSQTYGIKGKSGELRWRTAEHHAPALIRKLMASEWGEGVLINVNFPDCEPEEVAGTEVTVQGERDQDMVRIDERVDARGRPYYWLGVGGRRGEPEEGTDLKAIYDRKISVTPLHMDLTQFRAISLVRRLIDA